MFTGWSATGLHEHPCPELPHAQRTLESRWAGQSCHKGEGHVGMSREQSQAPLISQLAPDFLLTAEPSLGSKVFLVASPTDP